MFVMEILHTYIFTVKKDPNGQYLTIKFEEKTVLVQLFNHLRIWNFRTIVIVLLVGRKGVGWY